MTLDRLTFETIVHPNELLSEQTILRMVLTSIPDEVTRTIHKLHQLQFAEVTFWSPLQRNQESATVLSMYTPRGRHR